MEHDIGIVVDDNAGDVDGDGKDDSLVFQYPGFTHGTRSKQQYQVLGSSPSNGEVDLNR